MMPLIRLAGVTSKAGFQHCIPGAAIRWLFICVISLSGLSSITIWSPLGILKSIEVRGAAT